MDTVTVTLTWYELYQGAQIGISRRVKSLKNNAEEPYGTPEEPWLSDINGALGEMVVARALNVYWSGNLGSFKLPDVGRIQVRTAQHDTDRLRLHPGDNGENVFVLVTGEAPTYTLRGWLLAADGKREQWWCDPTKKGRPAFFVPQSELHPMDTLLEALHA